MSLAVLATSFGVIFLAELPDKSAIASFVLGTRYRPGYVFAGAAAAFAVHTGLAIAAGSLLALLPHRVVEIVTAVLFAIGAVVMLRRRDNQGPVREGPAREAPVREAPAESAGSPVGTRAGAAPAGKAAGVTVTGPGVLRIAATSFAVLFVAEFGDLTQVAIANLAARYQQPLAVGIGALAAMWAVAALAIGGGRQLLRLIPFAWITRAAAAVMAALSVVSVVGLLFG